MMRTLLMAIVVAAAFCATNAAPVYAFSECSTDITTGGHWPNPNNTANFGTQKWEFDWRVTSDEGLEISNVQYTRDLSQPKKLVIKRASLPFIPVHYPEAAPMCAGSPHGFSDTIGTIRIIEPFCCAHVPTTPCQEPDRALACMPPTRTVSNCPAGAPLCAGVCEGTQIAPPPIESGIGETVSGAADADVILTVVFRYGGYQFIQRWRFRDDGTLIPSLRAGGVHDCQWHSHQIYWRFHFQLAATPNQTVQECGSGGCPDLGTSGWSSVTGCGIGATPSASWRLSDAGAAGRAVTIARGQNDGNPSVFCEQTSTECNGRGVPCVNTRDFCAIPAAEPVETLVADNCNDHLGNAAGTSADMAFWYIAHVDHHDPCDYLPMCDPAIGSVAFGPTIRLVGSGW